MFYIFNKENNCVGSCDSKPNMDDLKTRDENAVESADIFGDITALHLVNGAIKEKTLENMSEPAIPPVNEERLAAFEAMAAQEARLVAQGERIAALEAELSALKGGEGK